MFNYLKTKKMKKTLKLTMLFVAVLTGLVCFTSCGDDDENKDVTIANGIDVALLPGQYSFNGNIAPSFTLYKDGTCDINGNSSSKEKWQYEKSNKILLVGTHVYTVKMLTKDKLVAEWSSVKYGISTTSWERTELPVIHQ